MDNQHSAKHRIFIALPVKIDSDSFNHVNETLKKYTSILKIVPNQNYHITLKFIGEVDQQTYNDIVDNFSKLEISQNKIEYTIKGLGSFPSMNRANVLWCGIKCDLKTTDKIKNIIEQFTLKFGIKKDPGKFKPHLTLARVKKNKKIPEELINFFKNEIETIYGTAYFDKIILYESKLTPKGPIYTELHSLTLN